MKTRQKKLMMVLAPASLFLGWRLISMLTSSPTPAPASAQVVAPSEPSNENPVVQQPIQLDVAHAVLEMQAKRARLAWGRDPFAGRAAPMPTTAPAAPPVRAPTAPQWELTGVSNTGGRNLAILAGRIVAEGDKIADRFEVIEVTEREVLVRDGDWTHRFTLGVKEAQTAALGEKK